MHVLECGSRMRSQKSVHVAQFGTCGLVYTLVVVVKLSKVFWWWTEVCGKVCSELLRTHACDGGGLMNLLARQSQLVLVASVPRAGLVSSS